MLPSPIFHHFLLMSRALFKRFSSIPLRTASGIVGFLCWLFCSALIGFVIGGMRDRARLIRDNDNEQILSALFASFRDYADLGAAIESSPVLKERIAGFALYGTDLTPVYRWGKVPLVFDERILDNRQRSRFGRYTIPDKKGHQVTFILYADFPPPPPRRNGETPRLYMNQDFFLHHRSGRRYIYIDIMHPAYWRVQTFTTVLFPLCCLVILGLFFYIRHLYLRNREYRNRIEAQKNLVMLGTAASTLAHEIKNPLLSIRLQTGILRKLFPDKGQEEVAIIDEEVERLAALIYRVNDYLREAEGRRVSLNSYTFLAETSRRLCGRNILHDEALKEGMIRMDPHRARSVFENILRNALESGGPQEAISASITRNNGAVVIRISDRGRGIPEEDLKRVFDPFFTRKSTGTGIGLSISKRFVEAVQGSITVENQTAGGTLVTITLPEYTTSHG
ncbi:MAG: HAMP domain-containing histidine kinase [Treponema sp.]|jgi:two-component system sensor histidine kinase HydH|nr:HAMP domain-containing histidine kinase [Treponema sp.]